jgi:hypothetical protein
MAKCLKILWDITKLWGPRGGQRMNEKELLDEIFELALQNDMNYLG